MAYGKGAGEVEELTQDNQKLISVIMPAYNCGRYISAAIDSIRCQSYTSWELIIVDDGSADNTSKIIDKYAEKDPRIKAFHQQNAGVSAARNFALEQISGAHVTFIDGDDVYHGERLKRMLRVFEHNPKCDAVFAGHREFKGELNLTGAADVREAAVIEGDILKKVISDTRKHFICNVMLKSEIAQKERFAPIRFAEDFCYIRDCAQHFGQIAVLEEALYFYRRDNENAMTGHFFTEEYIPDYMKLVENVTDFCKKRADEDGFYKNRLAHEYAQSGMRIRKSTCYKKFVSCMNDSKYRQGLAFADASQCSRFEKMLFFMIKHRIYMPFAFWIW